MVKVPEIIAINTIRNLSRFVISVNFKVRYDCNSGFSQREIKKIEIEDAAFKKHQKN